MDTHIIIRMKKLILTLIIILTGTCCVQAQEHLKFMGIPLTGNINSFQTKLKAKGFEVDKQINKYAPVGTRIFKGLFAGENAQIFVFYNKKHKIVYRAKAIIKVTDQDIFDQKKYELANMLRQKYSSMYIDAGENGLSIYVTNNLGTTNLGHIDLFGGTEDPNLSNYFTTTYCIHVDYWDTTNSDKNEDDRMEDL